MRNPFTQINRKNQDLTLQSIVSGFAVIVRHPNSILYLTMVKVFVSLLYLHQAARINEESFFRKNICKAINYQI